MPQLLVAVYPEYEWLPWKFSRTPQGFWTDPKNCKQFLEWSKPYLNVQKDEDWHNVSSKVLDLQNNKKLIAH